MKNARNHLVSPRKEMRKREKERVNRPDGSTVGS